MSAPITAFIKHHYRHFNAAALVDAAEAYNKLLADGGKMFVHSDEFRLMGTVSLFPDSDRAMRDNRYPLTEVGTINM